jgi:chemotaxis protein CheD
MNNEVEVIKVGIADLAVAKSPQKLRTSGLGSCVGIVVYDLNRRIAGLGHVMLPDSTLFKGENLNRAKYADTAIIDLVNETIKCGAKRYCLKAKIAGGAQMFQFASGNDSMRIGQRNVEEVKRQLALLNIPIVSEDVGGSNGRTIEFDPSTGILKIRTVNLGIKEI